MSTLPNPDPGANRLRVVHSGKPGMNRGLKIAVIVIVILILIVICIPLFVNANTFRPRLESELTSALGRSVKVGNLSLSIFSGSVTADNISIADDPAFSKSNFVQAKTLKVGVELIPLIFSKTLNITDLILKQPEITLVRSPNGDKWNFSSLGNSSQPASTAAAPTNANANPGAPNAAPALSVRKLQISDGRITVSQIGSPQPPRVYDKVDVEVSNFSFATSFPFKLSVKLPSEGTLPPAQSIQMMRRTRLFRLKLPWTT
jgi:AsmA protein